MLDNTAVLPALRKEDGTLQPAEQLGPIPEWMDTQQLADLAGVSLRAAQIAGTSCLSGGTWRGVRLEVRYEGRALMIHAPSLPQDLRDIWHERYKTKRLAQIVEKISLSASAKHGKKTAEDYALMRWKLDLITPALEFPKFSTARGTVINAMVGKEYIAPNGKTISPALKTLQSWLKDFEEGGETALYRKERKKEGPRVLISRAWDTTCPLGQKIKTEIAEKLEIRVKSLWTEGAPGWRRVNQLASVALLELSRAAGWEGATLENCSPGRPFVEKFREFYLAAVKDRHAKLFADKYTPRIQRQRNGLKPGDIVIGDVHPMDVVRKIDGRMVHARLISWLDVATYDIFVTVVILPPGRGIRQDDIAASFVDMVQAWGLPRQLRLDNGKEYKWEAMIKGFQTLAGLVRAFQAFHVSIINDGEISDYIDQEQFSAISRARPYNAPAKQIEHVFGILEYAFFR